MNKQLDVWRVWRCLDCKSLGLIVETGKCCAVAKLIEEDLASDKFAPLVPTNVVSLLQAMRVNGESIDEKKGAAARRGHRRRVGPVSIRT